MNVKLLEPYGYCFGVKNALKQINKIIDIYKTSHIVLIGPLVHNKNTNDLLKSKGVEIVENLDENFLLDYLNNINDQTIIVFSCHGHFKSLENVLIARKIKYFDLVCPIVNKNIVKLKENNKKYVYFIGDKNHIESKYLFSYCEKIETDFKQIQNNALILNQTTIKSDDYFKAIKNFDNVSEVEIFKNICNEPFNRYESLKKICKKEKFDYVFVVGDSTSANTKNLLNIYQISTNSTNIKIINDKKELESFDFLKISNVLVLSGTSTSNSDVLDVYNYIKTK